MKESAVTEIVPSLTSNGAFTHKPLTSFLAETLPVISASTLYVRVIGVERVADALEHFRFVPTRSTDSSLARVDLDLVASSTL